MRDNQKITILLLIAILLLAACQPGGSSSGEEGHLPYTGDYRVTLKDAKAAYDDGTAIFVDTRSLAAHTNLHIKGAISIPLGEEQTRYPELDTGKWIITYCT